MLSREDEEAGRLAALQALRIIGTSPEAHLDAVCRVASGLFGVPIALVTLIDDATVWIKARHGVSATAVPRDDAFCDETIHLPTGNALVLRDILNDQRHCASPLVSAAPHARFYAGVPIALDSGINIGTFCVIDTVPRLDFGERDIEMLHQFAIIVEAHLRLHESRNNREAEESRFRLLAENTSDIVILSDLDTTRRYVSPAAKLILGYEPAELIGTRPIDYVHPDDADGYARLLDDLSNARIEEATASQRYRRKDGSWVWMEISFSLTRDSASGVANGYVASLRDISKRKEMEATLRLNEERLALALDSGSDGLWDWDLVTDEVTLSGRWQSILGYDDGEIASTVQARGKLIHPDDADAARAALVQHLKGLIPKLESEYRVRKKNGAYIWTLARGKVVARDAGGRALRMVGTHIDITRRKEAERQVAHMASHDALTALPNRILFRQRLDHQIRHAQRHGSSFAVMACDLDRFKVVNDTLGHTAGDQLLKTVAERLKTVIRTVDTVARLGGDEFAIVLGEIEKPQDAIMAARRVIQAIEGPIAIDGRPNTIGVSIGIAIGPFDGLDADLLFRNADIALYRAKAAGGNTYRFFESGMSASIAARSEMEQSMREAVRRGAFELHYQPVVNLASGTTRGFEALLRWTHPRLGPIAPADFILIAEETGLIATLGEWVLREACREAATWPKHVRIAVNVSAVQFKQPGLERSVMMALATSGLDADRLELEITESVLLHNADAVIATLHRLRSLGVRIALDDFGTGYSSLSYLRQFPFDKIKIDRSFVREIADPNTAAIVRAVVGLGLRAGASITAEGIETEDQLQRVRQEGCTEAQGFLFSKALSSEDARAFIETGVLAA